MRGKIVTATRYSSHKRFILLLAVFLGSNMLTAVRTDSQQIVPAQKPAASVVMTVQTIPTPSLAAFLPLSDLGKSAAHIGDSLGRVYGPDQTLENLSPMRKVKTVFLTQSSLPLVQFWGGHLRLDGFTSRLHMQNVQFGPSTAGRLEDFCPRRQAYISVLPSMHLYGLSLSFHFGRDAQMERPTHVWDAFDRIVKRLI